MNENMIAAAYTIRGILFRLAHGSGIGDSIGYSAVRKYAIELADEGVKTRKDFDRAKFLQMCGINKEAKLDNE